MITNSFLLLAAATFIFCIAPALAESKRKPSSIDIKSTTEIIFFAKKDLGFSDLGKIKEYQGVLEQVNEARIDLSSADLYKFPRENKTIMTAALCNTYADKIFGPADKRTLKIQKSLVLFNTPVGKACEFQLTDSYHHAKLPYTYVISGFIHARLIALVWNFEKPVTPENLEKLKVFWLTLK